MRLDCRADEAEIKQSAQFWAGRVRGLLSDTGKSRFAPSHTLHATRSTPTKTHLATGIEITLNTMARDAGAVPVNEAVGLHSRIARMVEPLWWTRVLRREMLRENEGEVHASGEIHRAGQVYVSEHASRRKNSRRKANRATLEALEVVSDSGEVCNLQEVADSSVSNPALRRAELMVRCRGFEETAEFMDHQAIFLTCTTPSRFHRAYESGAANKKWDGSTPKEGHAYLNKVWQRTRAAWARTGATPYGFRVAEPHHDGTPHWHILLFMPAGQVQAVIDIARRYFCADSAGERGMKQHRFTVKMIDPTKGSATGYIAKYISKNIDGEKEGGGELEHHEGQAEHDASTSTSAAAQRVKDWATTWGIRQFQQIGGPSVTVWRELRRIREPLPQMAFNFEGPRLAADESMWSMFWLLQGGPSVPRKDLTIKPAYITDVAGGKYGDDVKRIAGITGNAVHQLTTRLETWTVQRAGLALVNEWTEQVRSHKRIQKFERLMGATVRPDLDPEPDPEPERAAPRTGVNNCTPPPARYFGNEAENPWEVRNGERVRADIDAFWTVPPNPNPIPQPESRYECHH